MLKVAGTNPKGPGEKIAGLTLMGSSSLSIFITVAITVILIVEAVPFFLEVSPFEFFFGTKWTPLLEPRHFGVLPLVVGTMHIVIGSALIAVPTGLLTGIYLSEYAPERVRSVLKPLLEILAGIPTIVYGFFALNFITPVLKTIFPDLQIYNSLSASIVVGIMILPFVATLCEDTIRAVPQAMREGAYALGCTKSEVTLKVVVPSALSGILASFILAISRAVGETMAVTLAAGATPQITANPLESIQTMTAFMVKVSLGDTPRGSVEYQSIFAVGLLLFAITLGLNILSNYILSKFRESYR